MGISDGRVSVHGPILPNDTSDEVSYTFSSARLKILDTCKSWKSKSLSKILVRNLDILLESLVINTFIKIILRGRRKRQLQKTQTFL